MKIIAICGIWDRRAHDVLWQHLKIALTEAYPNDHVHIERMWYAPYDNTAMLNFAHDIRNRHDTGEPVLLVGHSMGGILACAIAPHFTRSKVVGIATIFSPHRLFGGYFSRLLDSRELPAPIITFGTVPDRLVWWGSKHPMSARHVMLMGDHQWWFTQNKARIIARTIARYFEPE